MEETWRAGAEHKIAAIGTELDEVREDVRSISEIQQQQQQHLRTGRDTGLIAAWSSDPGPATLWPIRRRCDELGRPIVGAAVIGNAQFTFNPGLTGVVSIFSSYESAMALKGDGTVWAWGKNDFGQLGIGSTVEKHSPTQVPGLSGVTSISSGGGVTLALKGGDGTVWAWGSNLFGSLGDGTTVPKSSPAQVPGLTSVVSIETGQQSSHAIVAPLAPPSQIKYQVAFNKMKVTNDGDDHACGEFVRQEYSAGSGSGYDAKEYSRCDNITYTLTYGAPVQVLPSNHQFTTQFRITEDDPVYDEYGQGSSVVTLTDQQIGARVASMPFTIQVKPVPGTDSTVAATVTGTVFFTYIQ